MLQKSFIRLQKPFEKLQKNKIFGGLLNIVNEFQSLKFTNKEGGIKRQFCFSTDIYRNAARFPRSDREAL